MTTFMYFHQHMQRFADSQSYLYRQGIGIAKALNSELFDVSHTEEFKYSPIRKLPEVYSKLLGEAKSISDLFQKIINQVISPCIFADRMKMKGKFYNVPD